MATARLVPSTYYLSNTTYLSVSDAVIATDRGHDAIGIHRVDETTVAVCFFLDRTLGGGKDICLFVGVNGHTWQDRNAIGILCQGIITEGNGEGTFCNRTVYILCECLVLKQ